MGRPRKKKKPSSSLPRGPRKATSGSKRGSKSRKAAKEPVATLPSGPPRKPRKSASRPKPGDPARQRLQKVLAAAGYGSRRDCEEFIIEGRVEVDGEVVSKIGATVDPQKQEIRFDGDVLSKFKPIYYIVNKPSGVISTNNDPSGRMRVVDLVPDGSKLFTVGRLDKASEGLMLVTNDGELANRMAHPRYGIEKTYQVVVAGSPDSSALQKLRRGIHLAEGVVRVASLIVKKRSKGGTLLEMVLTEGRNREIRRMAASIGHKVQSLKRIGMGTLRIGTIPPGAYRPLTAPELKRLRALCSGKTKPRSAAPRRSAASTKVSGARDDKGGQGGKDVTAKPSGGRSSLGRKRSTGGRDTKRTAGSKDIRGAREARGARDTRASKSAKSAKGAKSVASKTKRTTKRTVKGATSGARGKTSTTKKKSVGGKKFTGKKAGGKKFTGKSGKSGKSSVSKKTMRKKSSKKSRR